MSFCFFPCIREENSSDFIMVIKSRMRWTGHVAHMEAMKNTYTSSFGEIEGKKSVGRPVCVCVWENGIRTSLFQDIV
jgi:hypothetical protein